MDTIKQLFKYKISTLVCGGGGPHAAKAIIKKFLDYRKTVACHCGLVSVVAFLLFGFFFFFPDDSYGCSQLL